MPSDVAPSGVGIVVLAGGTSSRFGSDKLAAPLGPATLLGTLLDGLAQVCPGVPVVAVGPPRDTPAAVRWVREEPPGGGPVAGLSAALEGLPPSAAVVVLAGDQPYAAPAVPLLLGALGDTDDVDAAVGTDPGGHDQPLLAAYRVGPLRAAIGPSAAGQSVRAVVGRLRVVRVPLPQECCGDVDTPSDLAHLARLTRLARSRGGGDPVGAAPPTLPA